MNDRLIRLLTSSAVLAVAGFAAVISYEHIYGLSRLHGQTLLSARLMPLSVDGLIAAASLVALYAARNAQGIPALARWCLGLGISATVAANAASGIRWGWLGALISAWPAVAFIGAAELALWLARQVSSEKHPDFPVVKVNQSSNGVREHAQAD
jgi:Protein of unknown function (DUF2637)